MTGDGRVEVRVLTVSEGVARQSLLTIALLCLFASLVLKPAYFRPSGFMQVSDFLAVTLFLAIPILRRSVVSGRFWVGYSGILFVAWTILINAIWELLLLDGGLLINSGYYLFDILLYLGLLGMICLRQRLTHSVIIWGTCLAAIIQWLVYLLDGSNPGEMGRSSILFNNPNQLAYWSLCSISICLAVLDRWSRSWRIEIPLIFLFLGLLAISLSKAGLVSFAALILVRYWKKPVVLAAICALLTLAFLWQWDQLANQVLLRIANIGHQADDSLVGRGYGRILDYPAYLILGAGEGAYERFSGFSYEVHSTLGSIFFSYGLIGLSLFGIFLARICGSKALHRGVYLLAPMLYGLTHQGLRFSTFWVLLAVVHSLQLGDLQKSNSLEQGNET